MLFYCVSSMLQAMSVVLPECVVSTSFALTVDVERSRVAVDRGARSPESSGKNELCALTGTADAVMSVAARKIGSATIPVFLR